MVIFLDTETRSGLDIRKTNVYRYVEDPDFAVLMLTWARDSEPVQVVTDADAIFELMRSWLDGDEMFYAWNAAFDRIVLSAHLGMTGYLDPSRWEDPAVWAAEAGYPRSLERCAKALDVPAKDSAGTRLINVFSKPRRDGGFNSPADRPEDWIDFCDYGANDVDVLRECTRKLPRPTSTERKLWRVCERINDRGMPIDCDLARAAVRAGVVNTAKAKQRVSTLLGIDNAGSVPQLTAGLAKIGLKMPNLQAETVERMLVEDELTDVQREVLELRQELALASHKKFQAGLGGVCADGRVRGSFKFYGASTGRWSGSGMQPQNLPRAAIHASGAEVADQWLDDPSIPDEKAAQVAADAVKVQETIAELLATEETSTATLKALVRPAFLGPMTVCDYSSIEARVLAWLANEKWALEAFRNGEDIYSATAAKMSAAGDREFTRQDGKSATLGLGYGGSIGALRHIGMDGPEEELMPIVESWRQTNKAIVRYWYDLWDAWINGGRAGRIMVRKSTGTRQMILPNGASIWYRGVRWEKYTVTDEKTGRSIAKEGWRYNRPSGGRVGMWHGLAVENCVQRVARDLLAHALVVLDAEGLPVIAHVHDEVLVEGEHPVSRVAEIMCRAPAWAEGLPVDASGYTAERYRKD